MPADQDLFRRLQPIQIEVKQFQPPAAVFVHQRERRRMHARRDSQPARQAFHELRFARAQIAAQRDDQSAFGGAAKFFAERFRLRRTMRNERGSA